MHVRRRRALHRGACHAPPACRCDGRVCGDDGCGGPCGECALEETCSAAGARCDCGDAEVTYTVSAPDIDWRTTARVVVFARQRYSRDAQEDEPPERWNRVALEGASPRAEITLQGACAPDLEIYWVYVSRWRDGLGRPIECEGDRRRLAQTQIELPAGTEGGCS